MVCNQDHTIRKVKLKSSSTTYLPSNAGITADPDCRRCEQLVHPNDQHGSGSFDDCLPGVVPLVAQEVKRSAKPLLGM